MQKENEPKAETNADAPQLRTQYTPPQLIRLDENSPLGKPVGSR